MYGKLASPMEINITTPRLDALKLLLINRSWRISSVLNLEITTCFNGVKFKIPIGDNKGKYFADQKYLVERGSDLFNVLARALPQKRGAVLDVGANTGLFMYMVCALEAARRYVAFEPNLLACAYLQQLISANGLDHHTVVPLALSNTRAAVDLRLNGETDVSATIVSGVHGEDRFKNSRQVLTTTGDDIIPLILPGDTPIALIKIDVEGAELEVLQGLDSSIDRDRPLVIFELWPLDENDDLRGNSGTDFKQIFNERRRRAMEIEQYFAAKSIRFSRCIKTAL